MQDSDFYAELSNKLHQVIKENNLLNEEITVTGRTLSVEEAIGRPERTDFPIVKGKERLMQADFKGVKGQAFTDMGGNFHGTLAEVVNTIPHNNFERAVLVSTLNAVLRYLGLIDCTVHCHDDDPEHCASELLEHIKKEFGQPKIALIGYQPAMLEKLQDAFTIRVCDLDPDNIGKNKYGVKVEGPDATDDILDWCDLIVATGSTVVNATITRYIKEKPAIFFGTSGAGCTYLMGLRRWCARGS